MNNKKKCCGNNTHVCGAYMNEHSGEVQYCANHLPCHLHGPSKEAGEEIKKLIADARKKSTPEPSGWDKIGKKPASCDKCKSPFEEHHWRHYSPKENKWYHTGCFEQYKFPSLLSTERKKVEEIYFQEAYSIIINLMHTAAIHKEVGVWGKLNYHLSECIRQAKEKGIKLEPAEIKSIDHEN